EPRLVPGLEGEAGGAPALAAPAQPEVDGAVLDVEQLDVAAVSCHRRVDGGVEQFLHAVADGRPGLLGHGSPLWQACRGPIVPRPGGPGYLEPAGTGPRPVSPGSRASVPSGRPDAAAPADPPARGS